MTQLHQLTAIEQAEAVRRGEISARELVAHHLERVDAYGAEVGAFVTVTAERALAEADAADAMPAAERGPLHGVPTAVKDLMPTAGVRTTFGSAAFADFVPDEDADVVALMRAAGLISLGKTTTSELGCSLYSEGEIAPPARNPWSPGHTAGGSSGGSAAAVAAGLVPVAQGTDGGGSIRIPAAICGLVGFKPSRGVVPGGPAGFGGFGLPTSGPIARTVADAAAALDAMGVPLPGEPAWVPPPAHGGYLDAARRADPGTLRVGLFTAPMLADEPVDPACVAAVGTAAAALAEAGHEVTPVEPPFQPDIWPLFETVWHVLALAPIPPELEPRLLPLTRWLRARGAAVDVATLMNTLGGLQLRVRRGLRALAAYDLLLCPTLARPQAPIGWFADVADPGEDFDRQRRFSPFCAPFNVSGQPAVSLPVGVTADGLPVGAMLAGRVGGDATLLAAAAQVERVNGWPSRRPPLWETDTRRPVPS